MNNLVNTWFRLINLFLYNFQQNIHNIVFRSFAYTRLEMIKKEGEKKGEKSPSFKERKKENWL